MLSAVLKKQLPSFWIVQTGGWTIYLVMIYITFLSVAAENSFLRLFEIKLVRTIIGFFLTSVLRLIYKRFGHQLSIQAIIVLVLICSTVFGSAWAIVEGLYNAQTTENFVLANFLARFPRFALDYAMTVTAWSALYFGVKNWLAWQLEREKAFQAATLANEAQLAMLRYQINPHFLFNSLNSIRASIDEDSKKAKQMITQLAEFLRYSLQNNRETSVSLAEEIEAAENYLAIEKTRFENRLEVEFRIAENAHDVTVPSFLINPLIENAVKHGLNKSAEPLKICISANLENNCLILEVANTGELQTNGDGTKIGLKNVRERLEKLFAEKAQMTLREDNGWVRAQILIKQTEQ